MDREKVINGLRICFTQKDCDRCPYQKELKAILDKPHNDDWCCPILDDALALLKEQEHKDRMFHALEEDWKRLKEQNRSAPRLVLCKDCIHWEGYSEECGNSDGVCFHNGRCEPKWFCADGERAVKS